MGGGVTVTDQISRGITSFTPKAIDGGQIFITGDAGNGNISQTVEGHSTGGTVGVDFGIAMPGLQLSNLNTRYNSAPAINDHINQMVDQKLAMYAGMLAQAEEAQRLQNLNTGYYYV